jgi:HEAT repeat protein
MLRRRSRRGNGISTVSGGGFADMMHSSVPQELVLRMNRGDFAFFLGYEGFIVSKPLAPTFGEYLAAGQPHMQTLPDVFSRAQWYESRYGREALVRRLGAYVAHVVPSLEPAYYCVGQFSPRFIISTSVDTRLETILVNQGFGVLPVLRNEDVASAVDDERVKVVKLFGSIDYPDTLVLTERDLIDLPERSSRIIDLVVSALATYPLLIVGQLLHDIHFRRLYRQLIHVLGGQSHQSYALCSLPDEHLDYWQKENVQIIKGNEERLLRYIAGATSREVQAAPSRQPVATSGKAAEPYKFLDYFEAEDAAIFFGRKEDSTRFLQKIFSHRLTVLCGKSGVGKTSLIKAGIVPLLNSNGRYRLVYTRCGDDPVSSVKRALGDLEPSLRSIQARCESLVEFLAHARRALGQELVILIDQFEEFFIKFGEEVHNHFLRELMQCLTGSSLTVRFVLSLREDYLSRLADLRDIVPMILYNVYRLKDLTVENAKAAIVEPAQAFGIDFEEGLPEAILKDIGSTEVAPPQVQIVCFKLYKSLGRATTVTHALYERLGGIKQILSDYLEESLINFGGRAELVKAILKAMVTSEGTKSLLSVSDVSARADLEQATVELVMDELVNSQRLVRKVPGEGGFQFELAHEYLTFKIWQWFGEEEIRQKEIQELLERELNSWRRFQQLRLGKDKLDIFNKRRTTLKLNSDAVELCLLSSIKHAEDCDYWVNWIRGLDVDKQDKVAASIMNIFSDSQPLLRRQAAEALARIGTQPLLRALEHHDPRWRCAAIEMIGGLEAEEAVTPLVRALDDANADVGALACGALGEIGKSMKAAARSLSRAQDETAQTLTLITDSLRPKFGAREERGVRVAALKALSQVADDKGVADWLPLLLDKDGEVRKAAEESLKGLAYCRIEEWPNGDVYVKEVDFYRERDPALLGVIEALSSGDSRWCKAIAGVMKSWRAAPSALAYALIRETDKRALSWIIQILSEIKDPDTRWALEEFAQCGRSSLHKAARQALEHIPSSWNYYKVPPKTLSRVSDVRQLIEHLGNRKLAQEAEDRLVRIGEPAVDRLIEALGSAEWRVRKHAAAALGRVGEPGAAPFLEELVDDVDERVSKAAKEAVLKFKPMAKVWMKDWQQSFH